MRRIGFWAAVVALSVAAQAAAETSGSPLWAFLGGWFCAALVADRERRHG